MIRCNSWTPAEVALLRESWAGCVSRDTLLRRLVGRTWRAIIDQMAALGLPSVPQGFVGVMKACDALGLCPRTFWRLVRRQRVMVHRSYSRSSAGHKLVEWDEVRDAVERETSTLETITGAARSRDVPVETLTTWLCAVGVHQRVEGRRRAIRLPSALFDTIVAWGRNGGRMRQALTHGRPMRLLLPHEREHREAA